MNSKQILIIVIFLGLIPGVGGPQHLECIYRTLAFTDPLQNITITVKMCNTLVLRDDWQLDPHKTLFVVDWAYLQDTQMKDGIVSLNLTNVVNDNDGKVKPGGQGKDQDKDGGEQDRGKDDGYVGLKVAQKNIIVGPGHNASLPYQICVKKQVDLDQEMKGGVTSTPLDAMTAEHSVAWEKTIREWATLKLISTIVPRFVPPVQRKTAESGQDVTLPCQAPNSTISVKWSKADLGKEYVYLNREGQPQPQGQHPSFKNRVDLQDRQMKDGDVSLILKNVMTNDTGTYECLVSSWKKNSCGCLSTTSR